MKSEKEKRREGKEQNGKEEEESVIEGVVLLLRQGVRGREDSGAAPEGQALQVPCLSQEALHRRGHGHTRPPGSQGVRHQVNSLLSYITLITHVHT